MSNVIIAGGVRQDISAPVKLWTDPDGFSFYKTGKLKTRNLSYEQLQDTFKAIVIHHGAVYRASHLYNGLISRGLSSSFIVDDNVNEFGYADIYQTCDLKEPAQSHRPLNDTAPGIEVAYQPAYFLDKNLYSEANRKKYNVPEHEVVDFTFHGLTKKVYIPTEAQTKSIVAIVAGFCKMFPKISSDMPRLSDGSISHTTVAADKLKGILSHLHITREKWDYTSKSYEQLVNDVSEKIATLPNPEVDPAIYDKYVKQAEKIFQ